MLEAKWSGNTTKNKDIKVDIKPLAVKQKQDDGSFEDVTANFDITKTGTMTIIDDDKDDDDEFPPSGPNGGRGTGEDFNSPLVLDLNSNNITSTNIASSKTYFDLDNNSHSEKTFDTIINPISNKHNNFKLNEKCYQILRVA